MPSASASAASTRDLVADRDRPGSASRTGVPVAGIDRRRPGRALAAAEHVRAHDEEPVGVDRRARARSMPSHHPTSPWPGPGRPGGVAVAGERVQHEHRVRRVGVERRPTSRTRRSTGLEPPAGLEHVRTRRRTASRTAAGPAGRPARHAPVTGNGRRASRARRRYAPLAARKPGVEVGEDVVERLDADREAHEVGRDAGREPARSASSCWCVVLAGWIARLRTSPTLARWLNSSRLSMKLLARLDPTLDAERDDRALAVRAGTSCARSFHGLDFRPGYATHSTSSRASSHSRDRERVLRVPLHAQAQRLEALEEQERVERRRSPAPMSRWYCSRALRMYCAGRSGSGSCENTRPW